MTLTANELFFKWYLDWYKEYGIEEMIIFFSLPSELTKLSLNSNNDIILDLFEKKNEKVNAKDYLEKIIDGANKYGVTIYLEPTPRLNNIQSSEHKNKLTREYLISYYENFGFVHEENGFMVKKPN
jgi:hypothetical protein